VPDGGFDLLVAQGVHGASMGWRRWARKQKGKALVCLELLAVTTSGDSGLGDAEIAHRLGGPDWIGDRRGRRRRVPWSCCRNPR
jgi:hypothetical protein